MWYRLPELNGRIAEQKAVLDHSEPFAYAAQNLYAASSAADAAAATAFLSGGTQTPLMRARYQQALCGRGFGAGRRDRRGARRRDPQGAGRGIGAARHVHRTGRSGAREQRAGLPDRVCLPARGVGLDADEPASRRREDLLRRPCPSRPGPAPSRIASDRRPRAACRSLWRRLRSAR